MPTNHSATLTELLEFRASEKPCREALTAGGRSWSYRELWEQAGRFATYLDAAGNEPGATVLIALPNGAEFFIAYYGCQLANLIPVPVSPEYGSLRIGLIASLCESVAIVVPDASVTGLERSRDFRFKAGSKAKVPRIIGIHSALSGRLKGGLFRPEPSQVAYVQLTSGTTGAAKAVKITHASILSNLRMMIERMRIVESDCFVSWLPTFHDMGLILMSLAPFLQGCKLILLPTKMTSPHQWLRTIESSGASVTASPDFGYRYCLSAVKKGSTYRLDSLRMALNAAEPVRARTVWRFEERFGLHQVLVPAYGLAESTAGVTCCEVGKPIKTDASGRVSVGRPFGGVEVKISNGAHRCESGREGEILVRSPANTLGYLNDSKATAQLIDADGFIHTGDLGYQDSEGELFITGRIKDVIFFAGRSVGPQEIEEVVDDLGFVRYSAAVGIETEQQGGDQLHVFAELRRPEGTGGSYRELLAEIVTSIKVELGFRPSRVYILRPRTIERTKNGKLRRATLKEQFLSGQLSENRSILFPLD